MKRFLLTTCAAAIALTGSATSWMSDIPDHRLIRQMSLPGAHDAATATASSLGQTQSLKIPELWEAGVRAFDFRPAYKSGSLTIYHGVTTTGISMDQAMGYLKEKLASDPDDYAFVITRNETKDSSALFGKDDYENWKAAMQTVLNNYSDIIIPFTPNLTLGDVRGKIVFFTRDNVYDSYTPVAHADNWGDNNLDKNGLIRYNGGTMTLWLQDGYNTGGNDKTNAITNLLNKAATYHTGNQWIINYVSGTKSTVSDNAKTQNKAALDWLNNSVNPQGRTGVVFMDYAGDNNNSYYGADLVDAIKERNFISNTPQQTSSWRDVSSKYLQNPNFDGPTYTWDASVTGTIDGGSSDSVDGWNGVLPDSYRIYGTVEYGCQGNIRGTEGCHAPAVGYYDNAGGAMVIGSNWAADVKTTAEVTLPAGKYILRAAVYNAGGNTETDSHFGWIPNTGTSVMAGNISYPSNQWTLDEVSFVLTEETTGKIQIGSHPTESKGASSSPMLCVDFIQILWEPLEEPLNYVFNPTFEDDGLGWTNVVTNGGTKTLDNGMLSLHSNNGDNIVAQPIMLDSSKSYTFIAEYKGSMSDNNAFAGFWNWNVDRAGYTAGAYSDHGSASDWTLIRHEITGASQKSVILAANGSNNNVQYRNIAVVETPEISVATSAYSVGDVVEVVASPGFDTKYKYDGESAVTFHGTLTAPKAGHCTVGVYFNNIPLATAEFDVFEGSLPTFAAPTAWVNDRALTDEYVAVDSDKVTLKVSEGQEAKVTLEYCINEYYDGPFSDWISYSDGVTLHGGHNSIKAREVYIIDDENKAVGQEVIFNALRPYSGNANVYKKGDKLEIDGTQYNVATDNLFDNGALTDGLYGWKVNNGTVDMNSEIASYHPAGGPNDAAYLQMIASGGSGSNGGVTAPLRLAPGKYIVSIWHKGIGGGSNQRITLSNDGKGQDNHKLFELTSSTGGWVHQEMVTDVTTETPYIVQAFAWMNNEACFSSYSINRLIRGDAAAKQAYDEALAEARNYLNGQTAGKNPGDITESALSEAKSALDTFEATVPSDADALVYENAITTIQNIIALLNSNGRIAVEEKRAITIKHVGTGEFVGDVGGNLKGNGNTETVFFTVPSATAGAYNLTTGENYLYKSTGNDYWSCLIGAPDDDSVARYTFEQAGNGFFYICNAFDNNRLSSDDNNAGTTIYGNKTQANADTDNHGIFEIRYADVTYPQISVEEGDLLPDALDGICGTIPEGWVGIKRDGSDTQMNSGGTLRNLRGQAYGLPYEWFVRWDADHDVYYSNEVELQPGVYTLKVNAKYINNYNTESSKDAQVTSNALRFTIADRKGYDYTMSQSFISGFSGNDFETFTCKYNVTTAGTYYFTITGGHSIFAINLLTLVKSGEAVAIPDVELTVGSTDDSPVMNVEGVQFGPAVFTFGESSLSEYVFTTEGNTISQAYAQHTEFAPEIGTKGTLYVYNVNADGIHGNVTSTSIDVREYPQILNDHLILGEGLNYTEDGHIKINGYNSETKRTITFNHEGYEMYYKFTQAGSQPEPAQARNRVQTGNDINLDEYTKATKSETVTLPTAGQLDMAAVHNGIVLATRSARVDIETGINSIFAEDADVEVYTLDGLRVTDKTLKPGIYVIHSGSETRKVVIK